MRRTRSRAPTSPSSPARPSAERTACQALAWSPVVTSDRLGGFVSEQQEATQGDFTPYERAADGTSVPVAARADYILVQYIEPVATNRAALGYDLQSDAVRNAAITQATDTGEVVATAPVTLVQETGAQQGILAVVAVYDTRGVPATVDERRARLTGVAAGVYRLGDLLRETFADPQWGALDLRLAGRHRRRGRRPSWPSGQRRTSTRPARRPSRTRSCVRS